MQNQDVTLKCGDLKPNIWHSDYYGKTAENVDTIQDHGLLATTITWEEGSKTEKDFYTSSLRNSDRRDSYLLSELEVQPSYCLEMYFYLC